MCAGWLADMKTKIVWKGGKVISQAQSNMSRAVERCAKLLENETKRALSRTGKAVSARESKNISNLNQRTYRNVFYMWGGTYTDKDGNQHEGMYWNSSRNKWVQASPVGTPPFTQTGMLKNSITHVMLDGGMRARVGPRDRLEYARRHELGGVAGYPARPYLKPSYDKILPQMKSIFERAARRSMR